VIGIDDPLADGIGGPMGGGALAAQPMRQIFVIVAMGIEMHQRQLAPLREA
jgi:hypothetical protein